MEILPLGPSTPTNYVLLQILEAHRMNQFSRRFGCDRHGTLFLAGITYRVR